MMLPVFTPFRQLAIMNGQTRIPHSALNTIWIGRNRFCVRLPGFVLWRTTKRGACLAVCHPWTLADAVVEYGRSFPRRRCIKRSGPMTLGDRPTCSDRWRLARAGRSPIIECWRAMCCTTTARLPMPLIFEGRAGDRRGRRCQDTGKRSDRQGDAPQPPFGS